MRALLREIDIPPLWFGICAGIGWGLGRLMPVTLPGQRAAGAIVIALGVGVFVAAIMRMRRHRTTVIPRRTPSALVTDGVFALSRNPIYLADAMILLGLFLWWGAVLALPLVAGFVWLITARFIRGEEAVLRAGFGEDYAAWCRRTRRWL